MADVENLSEIYLNKLKEDQDPGLTLTKFYWALFNLDANVKDIPLFRKLVRIYGRDSVFMSLVEAGSMKNITLDSIYGLLRYLCNERVAQKLEAIPNNSENLSKRVEELILSMEKKKRKLKIPDPFDE